jgi:hypothetical protein
MEDGSRMEVGVNKRPAGPEESGVKKYQLTLVWPFSSGLARLSLTVTII